MKIVFQHITGQEYSYSVKNLPEAEKVVTRIKDGSPHAFITFHRKEYGDFVMILPEFINKCTIFVKPETAEDSEELKNS